METKQHKIIGVILCLVVAVAMTLFYGYLMGSKIEHVTRGDGLYFVGIELGGFSLGHFLKNWQCLITFAIGYLLPVVLPWVLWLEIRSKGWIRFLHYLMMAYGLVLLVWMPTVIGCALNDCIHVDWSFFDSMFFSTLHVFPSPFFLDDSLLFFAIFYALLNVGFFPILCREMRNDATQSERWWLRLAMVCWGLLTFGYPAFYMLTIAAHVAMRF